MDAINRYFLLFIKNPYTTLQVSPWTGTLLAISCYVLYKLFFKKNTWTLKRSDEVMTEKEMVQLNNKKESY